MTPQTPSPSTTAGRAARSVADCRCALGWVASRVPRDLVVTCRPVPRPPMDVVVVRAPGSLHRPRDGYVLIEHLGRDPRHTSVERPTTEALPLFWRFTQIAFGIAARPD